LKRSVVIVVLAPFPEGGAPSSRVRALALALAENGTDTLVLAVGDGSGMETGSLEDSRGARVDFVVFGRGRYVAREDGSLRWRARLLANAAARRVYGHPNRAGVRMLLRRVDEMGRTGDIDTILLYNQEVSIARSLLGICNERGLRFFQQFSERHIHADYRLGRLELMYVRERLHFYFVPRKCDGAIVISRSLEKLVRQAGCQRILRIPSIMSPEQTDFADGVRAIERLHQSEKTLFTYVGRGDRRDALDYVIREFAASDVLVERARLRLIGLSAPSVRAASAQIQSLGIEVDIEVRGWLAPDDMTSCLGESNCFVLVRTDDISARSCFPTRGPELLLTGKPLIVSAVGDIADYLTHRESALLLRDGCPGRLGEEMEWVVRNQARAQKIGRAGLDAAERILSRQAHGARLARFLRASSALE